MNDTLDRSALVSLGIRIFNYIDENHRLAMEEVRIEEQKKANESKRVDLAAAFRVYGIDISDDEAWKAFITEYMDEILAARSSSSGGVAEQAGPMHLAVTAKPNIANLILQRLQEMAGQGQKSSDIKRWLKNAHNIEVHDKTPGMSLYRLSQEKPPRVHRKGHTWFFGPPQEGEAENPGAVTPGQA
jgi:hypothetical protein